MKTWTYYGTGYSGNRKVKGTVRPDWICMRVVSMESPLKEHLNFLFLILNIWKDFKILSRFMQKWIQPPACSDHGLHRTLSSYWLAHFYLMKKSAKELLYFCLDCGMMKFFTFKPQPKEQFISLTHLWSGLAKKIAVWAHANRDPNKQEDWIQFCMKRLRTSKSFKIFKSEIKKLKTYSGWCPFKGLSNDTTLM